MSLTGEEKCGHLKKEKKNIRFFIGGGGKEKGGGLGEFKTDM